MVTEITKTMVGEAMSSFTELRLNDHTLQAIARMGITIPTPIQAAALPPLLEGHDLIGQARTGSGKTLAFGIPAVEFVDPRLRCVQVLVLTPTRELAVQVGGVIEELGAAKGVTVGLIFGGRAMGPQRVMLRSGVHVVVGTPGRVLDLLNQGVLRLDKVRFLVLDEADMMLDQGFAPDVERIMSRVTPDRQTALFSATVPDWVRKTATNHLNDPVGVAVDPNPEDAAPIEHVAYDVPGGDKIGALKDLLDHRGEGSIIVFGRTKHGVKKLARQLESAGYPVAALQGNLSQNARDQVMADFRSGAVPILLATNVAARGLDVTHVEQVINVELPESSDLLTHRIGRTGRMGRRGQAITLLGLEDGAKWRQLERGLGRRIPRVSWRGAKAALAATPESVLAAAPSLIESTPSIAGRQGPSAGARPLAARPTNGNTRNGNGHGPRATSPRFPAERDAPARSRRDVSARQNGNSNSISRAAHVPAAPLEEPLADTIVSDPRSLVASYGRDPQRPSWTRGNTAEGRPAGGRPARTSSNTQRHQIDCAECGQSAEVPFRPDPTRPVYCSDCFQKQGRGRRRSTEALARA